MVGGGGGGGDSNNNNNGGDDDDDDGEDRERNKAEAVMALAEAGESLESLPNDLAKAIEAGRIPGLIVKRYFELQKSALIRWLLCFGGFKERLLADDLFLTKVAIECGVGIFTKVIRFALLITLSLFISTIKYDAKCLIMQSYKLFIQHGCLDLCCLIESDFTC